MPIYGVWYIGDDDRPNVVNVDIVNCDEFCIVLGDVLTPTVTISTQAPASPPCSK